MDDAPRRRRGRRSSAARASSSRRCGYTSSVAEADDDPLLVDVGVVGALADGHGHPAPVRVGAVHRRLHQRRVDDGLGDPLGLVVVAGAVDPRPRSAWWRPRRRGRSAGSAYSATSSERRLERVEVDRAGRAAGEDGGGVAGGRVGVDAHRVEGAVDHPAERWRRASSAATSASVKKKASSVAMSGSIMPTPLAMPTIDAWPPSAVGDAWPTRPWRRCRWSSSRWRPARRRSTVERAAASDAEVLAHPVHRVGPADHAGRGDEHVARRRSPSAAATPAASSVGVGAPCSPVATLAFFETTTTARSATVGHVGPAERDARAREAAAGEHRGGRARCGRRRARRSRRCRP